ncbi:stage II sporulation protein P [Syntrophomonas curvata]
MQGNNLITFIKNIFYLQLFLIVIIAGVGIDFGGIGMVRPEQLDRYSLRLPLPTVAIDSDMAANLVAFNSVALAGQNKKTGLWPEQGGMGIPQKLMAANFNIPVSRGEPASMQKARETELPLDKQEKEDYAGRYYDTLKDYKVVLYCTHSSESYIPDSGQASLEGKRGLVNSVAGSMAGSLESGGIKAAVIDRIHDYPDYNKSYTASRETVKEVVNGEKNLAALFDIHRDHIPDAESAETVNIKGRMAARILIIVGTDERKDHPRWKENLAFAEKLYQQGEKMYPGLIKGIRTRPGTYNQEFFDRSLLLEFGTDFNSLAEARHAAELMAEILLEVLEEEMTK